MNLGTNPMDPTLPPRLIAEADKTIEADHHRLLSRIERMLRDGDSPSYDNAPSTAWGVDEA
ncbi:MAG: hypothetical protein ACHQ7M_19200 [Chloroflexota bacterium]